MEQERHRLAIKHRGVLDYEVEQSVDAVLTGTFAERLVKILRGDEAKLPTHMDEVLKEPDHLPDLMVSQRDPQP